jgi:hypothetical protein
VTTLVERVSQTWQKIKGAKPKLSPPIYLLPSNVDGGDELHLDTTITEDEHYFEVRVHQLGLGLGRKWATTYEPMVLALTEFNYDGVRQSVPSMVGPGTLEEKGYKIPQGMLFLDTRVAGLHPYRGGDLSLTVILSRVKRDDRVRSFLKVLESTTAFPLGSALTPYLKMGEIALNGIDELVGNEDVTPALGFSRQFAPKGNGLEPQFIALLESKVPREELWVREGGLVKGPSREQAVPIEDMDFVLLSVTGLPERTDTEVLSFYPQYKQVLSDATRPDKPSWNRTKANMLSLYQALILSPDLTRPQADKLVAQYKADVKKAHDTSVDLAGMAPAEQDELTSRLNAGLKILEM